MFTILNDAHASSFCIECLSEEDLDLCYSETEVGRCDDCGSPGNRVLSPPIVIAATARHAQMWASYRDLDPGTTVCVGTGSSETRVLEGRVLYIEQIALLPDAEDGHAWHFFEGMLDRIAAKGPIGYGTITNQQIKAGTITAGQIAAGTIKSFDMKLSVTNNMNFQQYSRLLYGGFGPVVKKTGTAVLTGVTT